MKMSRIPKWLKPSIWFKSIEKSLYDFSKMYPVVIGIGILIIILTYVLPINGYLLVIIGLIVDIVGVSLIIEPVLSQLKIFEKIKFFKKSLLSSKTIDKLEESHIQQSQNKGKLGLMIIILGFILQIIGNYLQYVDSMQG